MKNYYSIFICCILLFSCQQERLSVEEYISYIKNPENGLNVNKEFNEFEFELIYKPVEFIAINEQRKLIIDTAWYQQRIKELQDLQYYTLKIASLSGSDMMKTGINTAQEYANRLHYFSDIAQYDIRLIDGKDTLTCALFHFERNYGVAPYNNIVLGFIKKKGKQKTKTLSFDEQVLGVGKVNLKIEENYINNIPQIILN
jgi:hypothetical protein